MQFLATMLIMVMLGVVMAGIRWSRIGAPTWLTSRRAVLLADVHATWVWFRVAAKAARDASVAWASTPVRFRARKTQTEPATEAQAEFDPIVPVRVGRRVLRLPRGTQPARHARQRGGGRQVLVDAAFKLNAWAEILHAENAHETLMRHLARHQPQQPRQSQASGYFPKLAAHAAQADSPAYFSIDRMLAAVPS